MHAWACEGDLPGNFQLNSSIFQMEWPPRSGRTESFPEVDHAVFFAIEEAVEKINPAQREFLGRVLALVTG